MEYIGFIAAFLTTVSFVPQAIQTIKTQNTDGLSFWMYLIFTIGVFCWLIYGFVVHDLPMILANIVTFLLALSILIIVIKNTFFKK